MRICFLISVLFFAAAFGSCYYDKYENFKPAHGCDSLQTTSYSLHVKEVFDRTCILCHSTAASPNSGGGVVLDTYEGARNMGQSGKLLSAVTWDGNASFMPKGAAQKIDECSIKKISDWINSDYPQ